VSKRLVNFSSLDLFDLCERKYYYEKIEGVDEKDSPILLIGTAYHAAIADLVCSALPVDAADKVFMDEAFRDSLARFKISEAELRAEMTVNLGRLLTDVIYAAVIVPEFRDGKHIIEHQYKNYKTGFYGTVDLVSLNTPVVDASGRVIGKTPSPCVIDWKTLTSDRRRSQRDAVYSPQLASYARAMNVRNAAFVEIPRNLEKEIRVRVVNYTEVEMRNWASVLDAQRAALISRRKTKVNFKPTNRKNPLCSPIWCEHFCKCYELSPLTSTPEEV